MALKKMGKAKVQAQGIKILKRDKVLIELLKKVSLIQGNGAHEAKWPKENSKEIII